MEVQFTSDQEAFIQQGIASGRYRNVEDAVRDAMSRWEEQERSRMMLLAALDEADSDLDNGRYTDYGSDSSSILLAEFKVEARAMRQLRA